MSRRVSSSCGAIPTIFTDHRRPSNYLPYGILRFRNEDLLSSQVGEIIDDDEKFCVSIDARNFAPNEITVDAKGNELIIGAVHVDSTGRKQFERRYAIPDNVVTECSETRITPDGVLTITLFKKHLSS
uniref:SHSP domain-containing protein n=1 Tax=Elaeophora elaphi TaxID=1147741 RepID=A0A0R3RG39_9BILA